MTREYAWMAMEKKTHGKTKNDARKHHSGKKIAILVVLVAIFGVLFASYALRSSAYLHARIVPKLVELGEKVGGTFQFDGIYAMGLTGIVLDHVRFVPEGMSAERALLFDSVTIYPNLLGMFIGDLDASMIEAEGFRARLDFSDNASSHLAWLMDRQRSLMTPEATQGASSAGAASEFPDLVCKSCHVEITHDKGDVTLDIPFQKVEFADPVHPWKAVGLSGEKMGACITSKVPDKNGDVPDRFCVDFASTGVAFDESNLHLNDLEIGAVELPKLRLNAFSMKNVEFRASDEKRFLAVEDGHIDVDISESVERFSGHYAFDYRMFELLDERVADRVGFGIAVKAQGEQTARIFGGYDRSKSRLGLTVDSQSLDFAPLLKEAEFSKQVTIHALPIAGKVEILADLANQVYDVNAKGRVMRASLSVPLLAAEPLNNINVDLDLYANYEAEDNTLLIDVPDAHLGKIHFSFNYAHSPSFVFVDEAEEQNAAETHEIPMHVASELKFDGEAAHFLPALPKNFVPALAGYKLEGPFSGRAHVSFDTDNYDALILDVDLALDEVKTLAYDPRSNFELIKTDNFLIRVNAATVPKLIGPREASWASFFDMPRETAFSFIASEDTKFFTHPGLDLRAIRASLIADLKADKVVRGGSTISQQVVKNLFLNHDKTLSRKFQEAFLTWQMEKTLPKRRILELYLNLAHWAKDTYGIRDAANFYFQKNVRDLTLQESLFLACILPNPVIFGKQYADNKLSPTRIQKMINIATNLYNAKRIDKATLDTVIEHIRSGKISDRPRPVIID